MWIAAQPSAEWNFSLFSTGRFPARRAGNLPVESIGEFLAAAGRNHIDKASMPSIHPEAALRITMTYDEAL